MNLIYLALTLGLIWLNLAGLTLQTWRLLPCFHIARSCAVLCLVLVLFFVEHFHGFGRLAWLWPLTSVVSAYALWKNRESLGRWGFWRSEVLFASAFLYSFAWRKWG